MDFGWLIYIMRYLKEREREEENVQQFCFCEKKENKESK